MMPKSDVRYMYLQLWMMAFTEIMAILDTWEIPGVPP